MALSKRVIETLLDLVEIKLSCIEVHDREDSRELEWLQRCRDELRGLVDPAIAAAGAGAVAVFAKEVKRRRPRAAV